MPVSLSPIPNLEPREPAAFGVQGDLWKEFHRMINKEYTKTRRSCRVTFELPDHINAQSANLVGEFNDWDRSATKMKKSSAGGFSTTISLKPGNEYRFRYLLDGVRWENDHAADRYVPNDHGTDDSVVVV